MPAVKTKPKKNAGKSWYVYILRCGDDSLYCGISNDVAARLNKHENGTGAKYTKGRGPFELLYSRRFKNRSNASKYEAKVKALSREAKLKLISEG